MAFVQVLGQLLAWTLVALRPMPRDHRVLEHFS
jgi:hypothetical protein